MNLKSKNSLLEVLGLGALIIYGVGDILGAGIYALIGKIAGLAESMTWLSFTIAMCIVFFTGLSYGELASRFPRSGGVSVYVQEAFGLKWLSILIGALLFSATILSMSTLSQAFVGYLNSFGFHISKWVGVLFFFIVLMLINIRGIKQSSMVNIFSTAVEISGLIIVVVCGFWYLSKNFPVSITPTEKIPSMGDILQGTALAFFAFTGFEDLVNVAEEAKKPKKNLPRAILFALLITGFIYLIVSYVATKVISGVQLSNSEAPLVDVILKAYPSMPIFIFAIIAIFAVTNTTLLNYITASRLLYGMSEEKLLPNFLQIVHRKYHTPHVAIILIFPIVLLLGLTGTLVQLAGFTSAVVLIIFSISNIALIKLKWKESGKNNSPIFRIPIFIPILGVILNLMTIGFLPPIQAILKQ